MTGLACLLARRAFRDPDPKLRDRLAVHASSCPECRERLALWESMSEIAPTLRKEWESPHLFPKISQAITAERQRKESAAPPVAPAVARRASFPWIPLLAAAAFFVIATVGLRVFRDSSGKQLLVTPELGREPLLAEKTADEVDTAEAAYVRSIEKLSALARPKIESSTSALMVNYREKLVLIDSAIEDLNAEIGKNRLNTHLRRELLSMYREKQRTLQDLMKEGQS